jgi:hypothetical protein
MGTGRLVYPDANLHRSLLIPTFYQISMLIFNRPLSWAKLMEKLKKRGRERCHGEGVPIWRISI